MSAKVPGGGVGGGVEAGNGAAAMAGFPSPVPVNGKAAEKADGGNATIASQTGCSEEVAVIFQACLLGRSDIIKNSVASIKQKPLVLAGGEELCCRIISQCRDEDGLSPLHVAAMAGHNDVIRSLLVS
jgi:hypothetical protein